MTPTASLSIALNLTLLRLKPVGKRWVAPLPLRLALGLSAPRFIAGGELRREAIRQAGPKLHWDLKTTLRTTLQSGSGMGAAFEVSAVEGPQRTAGDLNDGTASLPLAGSVDAFSGLTLSQGPSLAGNSSQKIQLQRRICLLSVVASTPPAHRC